jgi:hypothetical protein
MHNHGVCLEPTTCRPVRVRLFRALAHPDRGFGDAPLTSDAGLLPLRQFDERIGLTKQFAAVLEDPRDPDLIEHSFTALVRRRLFGILAGYEDQNDHDTLRHDPVFKLVADRSPQDDDLASQPTLSRLENAISISSFNGCASVGHTELSSRRSVRRRGHIDREVLLRRKSR